VAEPSNVVAIRFATDSLLEQAGFGLSVPRQRRDPVATDNQGEEVRFALDALLEEDEFEASVPGEQEPAETSMRMG
jgi:hypothetical protein